jgi:hypothetical protein
MTRVGVIATLLADYIGAQLSIMYECSSDFDGDKRRIYNRAQERAAELGITWEDHPCLTNLDYLVEAE